MSNKYQFFVVGDSDRSKDELRVKKLADLPSSVYHNIGLLEERVFILCTQIPLLSPAVGRCYLKETKYPL